MVTNSEPRFEARITRGKHTYIVRTHSHPLRIAAAAVAVSRWAIDSRLNFTWSDAAVIMAQLRDKMQENVG